MLNTTREKRMFALCLCVVVGLVPGITRGADSDREEMWEFNVPIQYTDSESFSSTGGTSVELNGDIGLGLGFGYNFNEYFFLGFEINWMSSNFDVAVRTDDPGNPISNISGTLDSSTYFVSVQYNLLAKTFTPFITSGIGSTYIDSNIPTGPPVGSCWWHPWWGYICSTWQPTATDTAFSYNASVGLRGDITDTFFLEAAVSKAWLNLDNSDPEFTRYRLEFGWKY